MAPSFASVTLSNDARLWPLAPSAFWLAIPLVAAAYAGVAALSLALAIPPGYASAVWPPAGIALAAWLAFGSRVWPAILIGAGLANFGVSGTPAVALAIGAGNTAEAALAGLLLARFVGIRHRFESSAAVWRFAAIALGAPMLAATNGVLTLALSGQVPWGDFGTHWITWWLGDATGIIIVTPLLLSWSEARAESTPAERRIEAQLFAALLALLCITVLWTTRFPADIVQKLAYLLIPLVTWAAARLNQRAVTAASFAVSVVATLDMLDGASSMFTRLPLNEALLLLQLFVSAVALAGLTLSASTGELVRVNAKLDAARSGLEQLLLERTDQLDRKIAQQILLARRMVKIRDEERGRLAADLHDGVAQDVTSLGVVLDVMLAERRAKGPAWFDQRLRDAMTIARRAGTALRQAINGLHEPALDGNPLATVLRRHAAEFEARTGILVNVDAVPAREILPLSAKVALLRICLEALANAEKHADADSVRVVLRRNARTICLVVEDNGRGFDPAAVNGGGADSGAGLMIMRERATAMRARFDVISRPGAGTRVECEIATEQR